MVRTLFIVAQGNVAVYRQLQVTVGREQDVEIIYDRRPTPRKPRRVDRLLRPFKRLASRRSAANALDHLDRRQQQAINEEIAKKGFAVIRVEEPARESRARLVVEPGAAPPGPPAVPSPTSNLRPQLERKDRQLERKDSCRSAS